MLNDEEEIAYKDSVQSLLNVGPNFANSGIVTFCDQVEIREFIPEENISDKTQNNDNEDDMWSRDPLSKGFCLGWSNAPCQYDRWCAELCQAASLEDVDQDSSLGMSTIFDELLKGPSFDSHLDIEVETDYSSLMQAHHQTSLDKVNLQALNSVAPPSGSFLVTIWAVEYGMGSPSSSTIRLNRGQENTWAASILDAKPQVFRGGSITDSKPPQIVLVDPQPTPSPTELVSDFHGTFHLHVIVDTFSHNCVPVLLDRVREGRWIDRKAYAIRVQTVADIFDRVGWRQDLQNEAIRCTLDDAGVLYEPADEVDLYGGYFGTLHVTPVEQAEPDSSSTSYGTCDSDIAIDRSDEEITDEFASFQAFAQFIDHKWHEIMGVSKCVTDGSNTSFRNEREEDGGQALVPVAVDEADGQEGSEQGESEEESPDLLDIPVMSRVWPDVEETMRANCNDEGGYPLVTFGLDVEPLGRRDLEVRSMDPHVLRSALYEVWEDCVPQHATLEIHFVHPQPLAELQIEKATILIVEVFEDDTYDELRPVLSIACNEHNALIAEPKPSHFRTPTFVQYAMHLFPQSHLCRPQGCRECEIRIAGRHVDEGNAVPFTSGSLFKLSIGPLPADIDQAGNAVVRETSRSPRRQSGQSQDQRNSQSDENDCPLGDHVALFQTFCNELDTEWKHVSHIMEPPRLSGPISPHSEDEQPGDPNVMQYADDENGDCEIMQTSNWLPQYELFVNHVRLHSQKDSDPVILKFHGARSNTTIQVTRSVVTNPDELRMHVEGAVQIRRFVIRYIPNSKVRAADASNANTHHFVVDDPDAPYSSLVVSRTCNEAGVVLYLGVCAIPEKLAEDTEGLHQQMLQLYGLSTYQTFQIDHIDSVEDQHASWQCPKVTLYTLHSRRHQGGAEDVDGLSLLQIRHVAVSKGNCPIQSWSSSECEFVQRSKYVQAHASQFETPMAWARVTSSIISFPEAVVDVLFPAPLQGCKSYASIVVELCSAGESGIVSQGVRVIDIPIHTDLSNIARSCRLYSTVVAAKRNGCHWSGKSSEWQNADVVTLYIDEGAQKWRLTAIDDDDETPIEDLDFHTVFFDGGPSGIERMDVISTKGEAPLDCKSNYRLAPVIMSQHKKTTNQQVWLATPAEEDGKISLLQCHQAQWCHTLGTPTGCQRMHL